MTTTDTRPWYIAAQQDGPAHPFRATFHHGDCAHCLGSPDAPAHQRAQQLKEATA